MVVNSVLALMPHDLLWGLTSSALPEDAPDWARQALDLGQPVVVRRESSAPGRVAVGVRGPAREQRYATSMAVAHIRRRVSPEQLVGAPIDPAHWPALRALQQVKPAMTALGLIWGVAGSAGYELASGVAALHQGSDLDLIVRTPESVDRAWAAELVSSLETAACRIDIQLQLPAGAIALREWARPAGQVLLKTSQGARLVRDPWQPHEACA